MRKRPENRFAADPAAQRATFGQKTAAAAGVFLQKKQFQSAARPFEVSYEAEEAATAAAGHSAACPARAKARRLAPCRGRTAPASAMCKPFPPPETRMKSNFPSAPSARSSVTRPKRCVYVFPSLPDAVAPKPKAEPAAKQKPAPETPDSTERAKSAASPQTESRRAGPPPPVRRAGLQAARRVGAPRPKAEPARAPACGRRAGCAEPEAPPSDTGQAKAVL